MIDETARSMRGKETITDAACFHRSCTLVAREAEAEKKDKTRQPLKGRVGVGTSTNNQGWRDNAGSSRDPRRDDSTFILIRSAGYDWPGGSRKWRVIFARRRRIKRGVKTSLRNTRQ